MDCDAGPVHNPAPTYRDYNNQGNQFAAQDDFNNAIKHYFEALRLHPNYPEAYNNLGRIYYKQGHLSRAIEYWKKALRINPNFFESHYNLGNAYSKLDHYALASSHYEQVLKGNPNHVQTHVHLGLAYAALEHYDQAVPHLAFAKKHTPLPFGAEVELAQGYLETGKTAQALNAFLALLEKDPNHSAANHNVGVLYLRDNQQDRALAFFKKALVLDPSNSTAAHMINALSGVCASTTSAEYVAQLFDQYADTYNQHMQTALGYQVPTLLRQAVGNVLGTQSGGLTILDLGCGTGLCGILFSDLAKHMIGCDLSYNMLKQAKALNTYEGLALMDIRQSTPGENQHCFDLILAGDVFVYHGELLEMFQIIKSALSEQALFAFTVEAAEEKTGYQLLPTGRFGHSYPYLCEIANKLKLTLLRCETIVLRTHQKASVLGYLVVLRR